MPTHGWFRRSSRCEPRPTPCPSRGLCCTPIRRPEAFVHDDTTGVTGLIDWSGAKRGPALYDVASAVMYLGGPADATPFLQTYRDDSPLGDDEVQYLDAFRRFRWVVQGAYFAWRLCARNLTGITNDAENEKGLNDARNGPAELGLAIA
jgi:Ser/Thr protein kinase RdoA (MazF antagonist)